MRLFTVFAAICLAATVSFADSGTLGPGQNVTVGNIQIANLPGAAGIVDYFCFGNNLLMIVHDERQVDALVGLQVDYSRSSRNGG